MRRKLPFSTVIGGRSTYLLLGLLALLCAYPFMLDGTWQHRLLLGSLNVAILVAAARAATRTHRAFLMVIVFLALPSVGSQGAYLVTNSAIIGDLFL